jgi:hypothetical protein
MRLSTNKVREQVDRAAEGSPVPAGTDPAEAASGSRTSARERGAMRRRARRLRRSREVLLLELGALVFESERRGRRQPELIKAKVDRLTAIDEEASALAAALGERRPVMELVTTGVAGACANCGTLFPTDARFCSQCGASTSWRPPPAPAETPAAGGDAAGGGTGAPAGDLPPTEQPGAPAPTAGAASRAASGSAAPHAGQPTVPDDAAGSRRGEGSDEELGTGRGHSDGSGNGDGAVDERARAGTGPSLRR